MTFGSCAIRAVWARHVSSATHTRAWFIQRKFRHASVSRVRNHARSICRRGFRRIGKFFAALAIMLLKHPGMWLVRSRSGGRAYKTCLFLRNRRRSALVVSWLLDLFASEGTRHRAARAQLWSCKWGGRVDRTKPNGSTPSARQHSARDVARRGRACLLS